MDVIASRTPKVLVGAALSTARYTCGRLTRGFQGVSLEIPGSGPPFVKIVFFIVKSIFYRKNHRKKNPELFVYITPEKTL